jgi:Na+-translocating ferredoxin:NAD+ oxidoreductase RnfG subunit
MLITVIILIAINVGLVLALRNLLVKVEKYEDITLSQAKYLQSISDLILESQKHLKSLDKREVFKSDDEVGHFFEQMLLIQKELDQYMVTVDYAEEKEQ